MIEGVDISHWENVSNWQLVKQNQHFVGVKVTQALDYIDPKFKDEWANCKANGLKRIAYHVLDMNQDPIIQAAYFTNAIGQFDPTDAFALDWEQSVNKSIDGGADACMKFFAAVEKVTNKPCLLYGSFAETQDMNFPPEAAQRPLWLARYGVTATVSPAPWKNWTLWQYTENGQAAGIGSCDLNYFNGTLDDLNNL
jgi:lysozyme